MVTALDRLRDALEPGELRELLARRRNDSDDARRRLTSERRATSACPAGG